MYEVYANTEEKKHVFNIRDFLSSDIQCFNYEVNIFLESHL